MANETDIRVVAAILTAGQLSRMVQNPDKPAPDPMEEGSLDYAANYAAKLYFKQIEFLLREKREQPKIGDKFSN